MDIKYKSAQGHEIKNWVNALGELRIKVFAEWPYLYQGDLDYERKYLQTYVKAKNSFVFMIFDKEKLVGATTAIALQEETAEFQKPFLDKSINLNEVVYFGESILLKEYRGQGFGKRFMQERLNFAKTVQGAKMAAFCAVQREPNHPKKPHDIRPLDPFWRAMGFIQIDDMLAQYAWTDIGESKPTAKKLKFWVKNL